MNCDDVPVADADIEGDEDELGVEVPDADADIDAVCEAERTMTGTLKKSVVLVPLPVALNAAATTLSGGGPVRARARTEMFPIVLRPPELARLATRLARVRRRSVCATAAAIVSSEDVSLDGSRMTVGSVSRTSI